MTLTSNDPVDGLFKMLIVDTWMQVPSCNQSCFVADVCDIRP